MSGGRARSSALVSLVVVIGALQVALPARQLLEARPSRFGWHMYSTLNPPPQASIETVDGQVVEVDLTPYIADPRAEIRWSDPLAEVLCRQLLATAVIVSDRDGTRRVPCS